MLTQHTKDRLGDGSDILSPHVFVIHAGFDEQIYKSCVTLVSEIIPNAEIHISLAGCTVSSHCGRNTLGVLFIRKHPIE